MSGDLSSFNQELFLHQLKVQFPLADSVAATFLSSSVLAYVRMIFPTLALASTAATTISSTSAATMTTDWFSNSFYIVNNPSATVAAQVEEVFAPSPPPPMPISPSLVEFAASFAAGYLHVILVYVGSVLLAVCMAVWAKYTSYPEFKMEEHIIDIILAAADFGGDILFIIEAFDKQAVALGVVASVLLGLASLVSFLVCTRMAFMIDDIDQARAHSNSSLFALVIILSATNPELVKLYPWRNHDYDGFPHFSLGTHIIMLALVEDVPQLICQLIFIVSVEASPIAVVAFAVTIVDILWRVLKRLVRLMAVEEVRPRV